ncbi:uncharacterized protein [Rutidosis leptorrhynchoides]|uniref:uncharacterized protein n=1 Tax=Rutidosis leptorrhynchoides TaxID=125765 RepID=UPI003A9A4996
MTPLVKFLTEGELPADEKEARKVRIKALMYALIEGVLYRKSYLGLSLLCIGPNQAKSVLREVHEGFCALHSGYRMIAAKVMHIGYYWPSIYSDAAEVVRTCQSCQQNAPISRAPRHPMVPKTAAWPFSKWAIHIVGPITTCSGGIKFLVVATDYFTKWVEAKALATITGRRIRNFFWEDIVCSTGETPFSLVYGTETVISTELIAPTKRIRSFDESSNDEGLRANLDMLEERREIATIREAINKQKISKYYDKRIKPMSFRVGDYVWCNNEASQTENTGKLVLEWEGPYEVIGMSATGSYILAGLNGERIPRTWHATNLKRC